MSVNRVARRIGDVRKLAKARHVLAWRLSPSFSRVRACCVSDVCVRACKPRIFNAELVISERDAYFQLTQTVPGRFGQNPD